MLAVVAAAELRQEQEQEDLVAAVMAEPMRPAPVELTNWVVVVVALAATQGVMVALVVQAS
jgi:hypothetical protein